MTILTGTNLDNSVENIAGTGMLVLQSVLGYCVATNSSRLNFFHLVCPVFGWINAAEPPLHDSYDNAI
jgi:hypothetical protein